MNELPSGTYVSVYKPIAGYKAVLIVNGEVEQSGYFAYNNRKDAEIDAKGWAEAEELPYRSHLNEDGV